MSSGFEASVSVRSAADYADFLLPHLEDDFRLLDVGCGQGTITVGLAETVRYVDAVDPDEEAFAEAQQYSAERGITNVEFRVGSVYGLDFPDDHFDACLGHSMLETLDDPLDGLLEIKRVLKPGAVLGVACVEYGGLILAGPNHQHLRRFYDIREQVWLLENVADPYRGRQLRGLLERAGFDRVTATSKYFSYGTGEAVRSSAWRGRRIVATARTCNRRQPTHLQPRATRCNAPGLARVVDIARRLSGLRMVSRAGLETRLSEPALRRHSRTLAQASAPTAAAYVAFGL